MQHMHIQRDWKPFMNNVKISICKNKNKLLCRVLDKSFYLINDENKVKPLL